ncbi:tubulin-like doman-containing protein [Paenibacillus sp. P25]|nr:tubulin-like doman-containing protein [Paenibacillus sp. P25]
MRSILPKALFRDDSKLAELNLQLRRLGDRIGECGRLYGSLQRLQLVVVTRADDPCNSLLPELTVLAKSVFAESFRTVSCDLFVLLKEKQTGGDYAYDAAAGVSFLYELDQLQSRSFRLEAEPLVTADGLRSPAVHPASPLFDTAYLIGDKDERGLFAEDGTAACSGIISRLGFLRCAQAGDADPRHRPYNHQQFKQNMMPPGAAEGHYASAGLAKVTRPDRAIALTVLHLLHRRSLRLMQENGEAGQRESLKRLASMRAKRMRLFEACWTASPMRSRRCTACCTRRCPLRKSGA